MPDHPVRERCGRGWTCRWLSVGLVLLATGVLGGLLPAQTARSVVYVVPINGVIDLGLAPFVDRVLEEAAGAEATAVILEINTFGGRVDAAVLIRDALLRARVVEAEAEVPRAMAEAFRQGNLGIMDYYRMKNVQADTVMREAIADGESEPLVGPKPERSR